MVNKGTENLFEERRSQPRFPTNLPVDFLQAPSTQTLTFHSHDISAGGICIVTLKEIPVGTIINIYIHVPNNGEKIFRKGRVVWSASFENGNYRIGIKLQDAPLKPIPLILRSIKLRNNY